MLIAPFATELEARRGPAEIIRPPSRVKPSEAAARYLRNEKGAWDPSIAPMLAEPLDLLASRRYTGIVFVGPARSSKTFGLIMGGITYVVTCSPGDMLITQMTQDSARIFSRTELDRVIRHSPELAARLSPRARDNNVFDKTFRSGVMLKMGWPAVSELSSKTLKYVFLTDYDRPANRDDVDGEGPMWDLAAKRIETFMSRGKALAESSPGEDYIDARWRPISPHEAPPARGIMSLYNRGSRARWYWPCQHCGDFFEAKPGIGAFAVPPIDELLRSIAGQDLHALTGTFAKVPCPHCGALHEPGQKRAMNAAGVWLHEGERIEGCQVVGDRRQSNIASFWLGGVAASYQRWESIVLKYLQGAQEYVRTGDESSLRAVTNTDTGAPYLPLAMAARRSAEHLVSRVQDWSRGDVPEGVRFLTAAADVQGNRFVCEVWGWGVGLERWLIDRFTLSSSARPEGDRLAALEPAAYVEDWETLLTHVVDREYGGRKPVVTMCDSGGSEGVTEKAYEFWRSMRKRGLGKRFLLVKGTGVLNAPRAKMTWPDSQDRKDRMAGGRGDVPVWILNVNILKDGVWGDLAREEEGPGYVHFPNWITEACPEYFDELTAETRTEKGWRRPSGVRNEAFDLLVYNRAAIIALRAEQIDWDNPPDWAAATPTGRPRPAPPPVKKSTYIQRPGAGYLKR
jgi:phage terminase large subunit GpA-like protein